MKPVVLLTDFGLGDHYAGVLHAVLVEHAPGVERIDLSHGVAAGDVWGACFLLRCAWPHLPPEAVVLAVVDPGVGTRRLPVAVRVGERWLVAPDNGLASAAGAAAEAVVLERERMALPPPSATYHGRDLFAPAAARLARGGPAEALGSTVPPGSLQPSPLPEPEPRDRGWRVTVLHVDRFGNVVTNLPAERVVGDVVVGTEATRRLRRVSTYGEARPDEVVALAGSSGYLELAVNGGSAAAAIGSARGDSFELVPTERR